MRFLLASTIRDRVVLAYASLLSLKFVVVFVDSKLKSKNFFVWTHWGRVGENGQSKLDGGYPLEDAIREFENKFKSKTSNKWDDRAAFEHKAGKYDLVETEEVICYR